MDNTAEIDRAYTAGLIDGEGCIRIAKNLSRNRNKNHSIQYYVEVVVGMTDLPTILYLQNLWGGSIYEKKRIRNYKRQWMLSIKAKKALIMIKAIQPFLITKREQANLALTFEIFKPGKRLDDKIVEGRHKMFLKMRELKQSNG